MRLLISLIFTIGYVAIHGQGRISEWTDPNWNPASTLITYASHDGNDWEIFVVNPKTKIVTQITDNAVGDSSPSWKNDGSAILYESNQNGNTDIFIYDLESKQTEQLTDDPSDEFQPAMSPMEPKLLFVSDRTGSPHIYSMNIDGGELTQITLQGKNEVPVWSKNGDYIAYHSNWMGHWEIFVSSPDGCNLISPTHTIEGEDLGEDLSKQSKYIGVPFFSPDGSKIAFHAAPKKVSFGIYVVDLNSLEITEIINESPNETFPAWSNDNQWIAFRSNPNDSWGLYIIHPDGTGMQRIADLSNPK